MKWKSAIRLGFVAAAILFADFATKGMVNFYLSPTEFASRVFPYGGVAVFQNFLGVDFCIHHVTNRGAAWGMGAGFQVLLLIIRMAVVVGLAIYLMRSKKAYAYRYPITMILAGGLGNIFDFFIYGHVIDMFHFIFWGYSYPVFNIADSSIFLGVVWLLGFSLFQRKKYVAAKG